VGLSCCDRGQHCDRDSQPDLFQKEEVAVSDFKKAVYGTTQKDFGLQVLMGINQLNDGEVAVIWLEGANTCNSYAVYTTGQEIEDYYNEFVFEGE
jgi:hypothetical protein